MSTLHSVNKSPFTSNALQSCLAHCQPGDAILLIEDGVYGALADSSIAEAMKARADDVSLYALEGDTKARGLNNLLGAIKPVGYDGFVELATEHSRTQSWL